MSTPRQIADALRGADRETVLLGDEILVAPFCGRILAAGPGGGENAIWINPAMQSSPAAADLLAGDGWLNHGGDRVWVSPEMETHVEDPDRMFETYDVAAEVDPGAYQIAEQTADRITMRSSGAPRFKQSGRSVELAWSHTVERHARPNNLDDDIAFVGYQTTTTLRASDYAPTQPALWRLLQVPGGGRITALTNSGETPLTLFGEPELAIESNRISCDVDTDAYYKFAIHHRDSAGIFLYRHDRGEHSDLIVRKFTVVPDGMYSDVPNFDPEKRGYIVQVYVDDGGFGEFGELEHHSTALHGDLNEVTDVCQTLIYRGAARAIDQLAAQNGLD